MALLLTLLLHVAGMVASSCSLHCMSIRSEIPEPCIRYQRHIIGFRPTASHGSWVHNSFVQVGLVSRVVAMTSPRDRTVHRLGATEVH